MRQKKLDPLTLLCEIGMKQSRGSEFRQRIYGAKIFPGKLPNMAVFVSTKVWQVDKIITSDNDNNTPANEKQK
jgi:hypothetical protein